MTFAATATSQLTSSRTPWRIRRLVRAVLSSGFSQDFVTFSTSFARRSLVCFNSSPSPRPSIEGASRLVQLVSGEPLKDMHRADVAHQPEIADAVTSGANGPRPYDCNARSDALAQAKTSGRDPGLYYAHVP